MKKYFMMAMATAMFSMTTFAQQGHDNGNRMKRPGEGPDMNKMVEMRANQIANQLSLDDATTAKFTEIYKSYVNDLQAVNTKYHPKKDNGNKTETDRTPGPREPRKALTDKDVEDRMLNGFKLKKEKIEVQENYYKKFRAILNPKQIQKVFAMGGENGRKGMKGMRPGGKKGGHFKGGKRGGPGMMRHSNRGGFAMNAPRNNGTQM